MAGSSNAGHAGKEGEEILAFPGYVEIGPGGKMKSPCIWARNSVELPQRSYLAYYRGAQHIDIECEAPVHSQFF